MKKIVTIEGMHCQNCLAKVEKVLGQIDDVKSAKGNLKNGTVTLKLKKEVDPSLMIAAVDQVGYQVTEVK